MLCERGGGRVQDAVLVCDDRRQPVRDQRLRDALVEVGAPCGAGFAGVEKYQAQVSAAENLAHRAFAEAVFLSLLIHEDEAPLAALLIVGPVADEMDDVEFTVREIAVQLGGRCPRQRRNGRRARPR